MIDKLTSLGAQADGEVGDPHPQVAAKNVLHHASYDEVIVSTLPRGLSGWLKADVPSQVASVTGGLVTTIEAEQRHAVSFGEPAGPAGRGCRRR